MGKVGKEVIEDNWKDVVTFVAAIKDNLGSDLNLKRNRLF